MLEKWSSKNIALMQFIHLAPLVPCLWSKHYKDDCSGESAYPPPARHRFDSPARCQTWLCFLSDSALTLDLRGFFLKKVYFFPILPENQTTTIPVSYLMWIVPQMNTMWARVWNTAWTDEMREQKSKLKSQIVLQEDQLVRVFQNFLGCQVVPKR